MDEKRPDARSRLIISEDFTSLASAEDTVAGRPVVLIPMTSVTTHTHIQRLHKEVMHQTTLFN